MSDALSMCILMTFLDEEVALISDGYIFQKGWFYWLFFFLMHTAGKEIFLKQLDYAERNRDVCYQEEGRKENPM